ncbi:MAG: PorT family protein [Tannerellaceae bacterium]|jgi:hypothetical protein|nr:PorT family protein [Tannerellaceae bacterium]
MKKVLLLITALGFLPGLGTAVEPAQPDTTIIAGEKRIEIRQNDDRMKVRVYEITGDGRKTDDEMVFEGHYRDGKSYERRQRSINIPLPSWNKHFDGHWDGFGMGFAGFADEGLRLNDIDGVSLRSEQSLEYNFNVLETSIPLSKRGHWAAVTGAGMRWSRYRLDGNRYFKETDGITSLHNAPEGIHYSASKLNITSLAIPLLLEWQGRHSRHDFFVTAGVAGVVKTASSSRVVYRDEAGKKRKDKMDGGMNIRPVTMDFLFQAGCDWLGVYVKYSPMGLFEAGKGPEVHPVSIGLHLHL